MKSHCNRAATALLVGVLSMPTFVHALPVIGQGTWEATLQGRDLDGNPITAEAYYDTVLGITWLADAGYAGGTMNWVSANAWATGLNPYSSGITGWRLPSVSPVDGTTADDATVTNTGAEDWGYNVSAPGTLYSGSTASELAHLFYNTLGDKAYCDPATSTESICAGPQAGWGPANTGPFSNLAPSTITDPYWSATAFVPTPGTRWLFNFYHGLQASDHELYSYAYAWAVHPGDVGSPTVPDADSDGIADSNDNCTVVPNAGQCDSDGDGYGNRCDGDLNNNGSTNAQDTTLFRQQLGQSSVGPTYNKADLNCNGAVNAQDTTIFRQLLGLPPGPSGLVL